MFRVLPTDAEKFQLYKAIESKATLPVAYRMRRYDFISVPQSTSFTWKLSVKSAPEKPRRIVVDSQTDNDGDETMAPSIFDHVDVKDMYIMLNSTRYPMVD